jgi:trk system potassium uptake protein TrkH
LSRVLSTVFRGFYPDQAIRRFRIGDRKLADTEASREFEEAAIIAFLWITFPAVGVFVLLAVVPPEFTLENVLFEVTSAQGDVGLSSRITGAGMMSTAKVMFPFNMLIGRLEIIPVLVLLRAVFRGANLY